MKCPICGRELKPVGSKSGRVKCDACRNVYDRRQVMDYYNETELDESAGQHQYETAHMHQTEVPHYSRPTGGNAAVSRQVAEQRKTGGEQRGGRAASNIETDTNKAAVSIFRVLVVIAILFVLLPLLTGMLGDLLESATSLLTDTPVQLSEQGGDAATLRESDISVSTRTAKDDVYGDVVITTFRWTCPENDWTYPSFFSSYDVTARQKCDTGDFDPDADDNDLRDLPYGKYDASDVLYKELPEAYSVTGDTSYSDDTLFDILEPGDKGEVQMVFSLDSLSEPVMLTVRIKERPGGIPEDAIAVATVDVDSHTFTPLEVRES